jgi:AcrR family transcriptional regulator
LSSRRPSESSTGAAGSRQRLLAATIDLVASKGCQGVAAAEIASAAGTDLREFDRHFGGEGDCLRATLEEVCDRFDCHLLPIYLSDKPWRERMRSAAVAAADYCLGNENEVLFVLAARGHCVGLDRVERSLCLHLEQIDSFRDQVGDGSHISPSAPELSLGSFLATVARLGSRRRLRDLPDLVPELLYGLFRLYLDVDAAEQELALAATAASKS